MEHHLGPADGRVDALVGSQVPFDDLDVTPDVGEILPAPCGEVVEDTHAVAARDESAHEVGADETAATRHENDAAHELRTTPAKRIAGNRHSGGDERSSVPAYATPI